MFDERRYFIPGDSLTIVRHLGVDIALTVCEDLWQDGDPFTVAGKAGAGIVFNINSSPYERHKDDVRLPLLQRRSAAAGAPVAYVNSVAGQDELVFDGDSMVVAPDGEVVFRAPQFVEDVFVVDVPVAEAPDRVPDVVDGPMTVCEVLDRRASRGSARCRARTGRPTHQ